MKEFLATVKQHGLDRMIFFGEQSLRTAVREFLAHYHRERNHQGLNNRLLEPDHNIAQTCGEVQCRERLGGLLNYYYRPAA